MLSVVYANGTAYFKKHLLLHLVVKVPIYI